MRTGWDYSHYRPSTLQFHQHNVTFVCRYLLPDALSTELPTKGLSYEEAKSLNDLGIDVVCNYEYDPVGMAYGAAQGTKDALIVLGELGRCQVPKTAVPRPVMFSADDDFTPAMIAGAMKHMSAAKALLAPAGFDVGVYGGIDIVTAAFNHGFNWAWQTFAWSGRPTRWHPRAQLRQITNNDPFNFGKTDTNISMAADFGQWNLSGDGMATVEEIWRSPQDIAGAGRYAPISLLGELYLRSGARNQIPNIATELAAMHTEINHMAADIQEIKDAVIPSVPAK